MPYLKTAMRGIGQEMIGPGESPMGPNPQPGDVPYTSLPAPTVEVLPNESNVFSGKPPGTWDRVLAWVNTNPTAAVLGGGLLLVVFLLPPGRRRR